MKDKAKKIIFINREDYRNVISTQQYDFIVWVLETMLGPDELKESFPEEGFDAVTVQHRIQLRKLCDKFNISIVDDKNNGLKIYVDKTLVGEWKKPWSIMKKDLEELDSSKCLFLEVHLDWWVIFEEDNGQNIK